MKTRIAGLCCLVAVLLVAGCGPNTGNLAPMSGKLTIDGEPAPGVEIVFSPQPVEGNSNVGPYSFGTTDAEGNYELKTRYGETGAIVGKHIVTLQYSDIEEGAMEELQDELQDAKEEGEGAAEVATEIEALKNKLKGRPRIPASAGGEYEVPQGGNKSANFELVNKK